MGQCNETMCVAGRCESQGRKVGSHCNSHLGVGWQGIRGSRSNPVLVLLTGQQQRYGDVQLFFEVTRARPASASWCSNTDRCGRRTLFRQHCTVQGHTKRRRRVPSYDVSIQGHPCRKAKKEERDGERKGGGRCSQLRQTHPGTHHKKIL